MMLPGITASPPNFLTPSRRPRLSRPLRDEPPAFLWAIRNSFLHAGLGCRLRPSRAANSGDAQHRLVLAMTLFPPVIVPPLFLEDDDLCRANLLDDRGANRGAGDERRAGRDFRAVADHQHLVEFDIVTR